MMRAVLALCAGAVLGLSVAVTGCESDYDPGPESGGAKGPEMANAPSSGQPASPSASTMTPGAPSAPTVFPSIPCDEGLGCTGAAGCMSACDLTDQMFTACARCQDGAFAACTDQPCQ